MDAIPHPFAPPAPHRRERLIFALDTVGDSAARNLVAELGDAVAFYKLGLGLLTSAHYFDLVDDLAAAGHAIFADLKLFDIPATVAAAVSGLRGRGIRFVTVHGDQAMLQAAVDAAQGEFGILAVTVLTSLDAADLAAMGYAITDVQTLVLQRARVAHQAGCAGVIASGHEAAGIRAAIDAEAAATRGCFQIVTPGVRPAASAAGDQKRIVTPERAFANGADYIVVGRPIRDAADPRGAARSIQDTIAGIFDA